MELPKNLPISGETLIQLGIRAVAVLIIFLLGIIAHKMIRKSLAALEEKNYVSKTFVTVVSNFLKWVIVVIVLLLILQQIGISIDSLWTVISALLALFAVGFVAVWSILSNVLCTLMLLIFAPFRIGDRIELREVAGGTGIRGKVININMMYTTLEEEEDNSRKYEIRIPNNLFFQKIIRCSSGWETVSLNKQLFEEDSLVETAQPSASPKEATE